MIPNYTPYLYYYPPAYPFGLQTSMPDPCRSISSSTIPQALKLNTIQLEKPSTVNPNKKPKEDEI